MKRKNPSNIPMNLFWNFHFEKKRKTVFSGAFIKKISQYNLYDFSLNCPQARIHFPQFFPAKNKTDVKFIILNN